MSEVTPTRPVLDATDDDILGLLAHDARRSLADIGARVNLSASAVKRRIDRLEQTGIITGYTTVIDYRKLGRSLEAFTELRFAGTASIDEIRETVAGAADVLALFMIAGDPDAMVWLRVDDVDGLRRTIDALRHSGLVTGTKTLMVLQSWWRNTDSPAPALGAR